MKILHPRKAIDIVKNKSHQAECNTVKKYEIIDALWGIETIRLTDKDINALKAGEYIYTNNDEYATLLFYEEE